MSRKGVHSYHTRFHIKRLRRRERLARGIRHAIGYINRQCSGYPHKARFTRAIYIIGDSSLRSRHGRGNVDVVDRTSYLAGAERLQLDAR